jgi:hypothetical protein
MKASSRITRANATRVVDTSALFIMVGAAPNTEGRISGSLAAASFERSAHGFGAGGDVRSGPDTTVSSADNT